MSAVAYRFRIAARPALRVDRPIGLLAGIAVGVVTVAVTGARRLAAEPVRRSSPAGVRRAARVRHAARVRPNEILRTE